MKIAVVGAGYVGLTTASVLASWGHVVKLVEKDAQRRTQLEQGEVPFFEPGLAELVRRQLKTPAASGEFSLQIFSSLEPVLPAVELTFLCVGTPSRPDGRANLDQVFAVAAQVGKNRRSEHLLVIKSTVPPGTARQVADLYPQRVASNPEFLREGSALADTLHPERIVLGVDRVEDAEILRRLYAPTGSPILVTDPTSAELIKYASNAFLATKISFINSIANLCEKLGADVTRVAQGMGLDSRIGPAFLGAGIGYGGSCFPKDTLALEKLARQVGYNFRLLQATRLTNLEQRLLVIRKLEKELGPLAGKKIALWGLAFKANTDDLRQAPALTITRRLRRKGAQVVAYDPVVAKKPLSGKGPGPALVVDPYAATAGAHALVIVTDWAEFSRLDLERVYWSMAANPVLIDGRNLLDPARARAIGFRYHGIGR